MNKFSYWPWEPISLLEEITKKVVANLNENDYHYHSQGVFPLDLLGGKDESQ